MAKDESFGSLLGRYRNDYGWSQNDLAKKVGVSRGSIALWESGERHPQFRGEVLRLADELHLSKEERKAFFLAANFTVERWPVEVWNVPHHRKPFFVGREGLLQSLRKDLVPGGRTTALTQAISGLGGIGKTQVAVEYAHRCAHDYEAVLWLQADSWQILTVECLRLAIEDLGLPEQQEADKQVEEVKRWLQTHRRWLLILDNVEEPQEILPRFLPTKHQGSVLVTTRRRDVESLAQSKILHVFSRYEGVLFLLRRTGKIRRKAPLRAATREAILLAKNLYTLLDGLPLALDQAGAYIAENGCSLQRYIDLYQQFRPGLLDHREATEDHPDSVLITFLLSWEQIKKRNMLAGKILQFCAFLASDQIPEQLVVDGITPEGTRDTRDALGMDEALGLLYRYSLIERAEQTLSLHRLVQEVMQEVLSGEEKHQWMKRAIRVVNASFPNGEHGTWPLCEFLLSHALMCVKWTLVLEQKEPDGIRLLDTTGRYLYERAQYKEAEPLLQRALSIREEHLGTTHPDTAASLNNLAQLYRAQGRYPEAELLLQRALFIRKERLEPAHPNTATNLNNLALLYRVQGRYAEAEPLLQRALSIREEHLGATHPDTAASLNNLALLYETQGRYAEAEPLLQQALRIVEERLGATHPYTAASLNNLAQLYQTQGRYAEAESLLQRALSIREEHLGATHPDTAASLNNLALLYRVQGRYAEAEPLLQRALSIREEHLGATHPDTATNLNNLAQLYQTQGRYAEAEPLLQRALHIVEKHLGATHPTMATGLNNLAQLYQTQGRYAEAEPLLQRALSIHEEHLGTTHPDTAASLNNLALLYHAQGRYAEAEPLLRRAALFSHMFLGREYPQTQQIVRNYLKLLSDMHTNGDVDAVLQLLRQQKQDGTMDGKHL
jgi:tetratricopeptide (TPR) repeat protein/transcriptional regulator with XRE-family HTH domain